MCKKCVATLTTISPMMKEHLADRFADAMVEDMMAFDEMAPTSLIAYEIHAEALKSTIDGILMDEISNIMIQALTGDMTGLVEMLGESTDFQKEWA